MSSKHFRSFLPCSSVVGGGSSVDTMNKASSLRRGGACSVTIMTAIAGVTSYMGLWIVLPILGIFDVAYTLYFGPGEFTFDITVVDVLIVVDMSFTLVYWIFHYTYKKLNPEQIPLEFSTIATKQYRLIVRSSSSVCVCVAS